MAESFASRIALDDVSTLFGRPVEIPARELVGLDYRDATQAEIDEARTRLSEVLSDTAIGTSGLEKWEQGWAEVRARVTSDGVSEATLAPQYFRHRTLRLGGRFIRARSTTFEPRLYHAIKSVLFRRYLADAGRVVELGCGTGLNLLQLHRLFPGMRLMGCDFARPSQELIALIAAATGSDMTAARFDMRTLEGHEALALDGDTAVTTLHAMEQLGGDFAPLLDHLVAARPKLVLHVEPIVELYDPANPFDRDAIAYHRKRGYLDGFLPALQTRGDVDILEVRRLGFGSTFHEAYSVVVWRPKI